MTDRDTRDEAERIIAGWSVSHAGEIADALLAAGLVVPSGLTAEKLRAIADNYEAFCMDSRAQIESDLPYGVTETRELADLREWADALSTQETQ